MEKLIGDYKADNRLDYYSVVLNLNNGEKIMIKNAGCQATSIRMALNYWGMEDNGITERMVKYFFLNTNPTISVDRFPKKYSKYFK